MAPPDSTLCSAQFRPSSLLFQHLFSTQNQKSDDDGAQASLTLRSLQGWPLFKKPHGISNFQILSYLAVTSTAIKFSPHYGGFSLLCFASLYGMHKYEYKHRTKLISLVPLALLQILTFHAAIAMVDGQAMSGATVLATFIVAFMTGFIYCAASDGEKLNLFPIFLCSFLAPLPGLILEKLENGVFLKSNSSKHGQTGP